MPDPIPPAGSTLAFRNGWVCCLSGRPAKDSCPYRDPRQRAEFFNGYESAGACLV